MASTVLEVHSMIFFVLMVVEAKLKPHFRSTTWLIFLRIAMAAANNDKELPSLQETVEELQISQESFDQEATKEAQGSSYEGLIQKGGFQEENIDKGASQQTYIQEEACQRVQGPDQGGFYYQDQWSNQENAQEIFEQGSDESKRRTFTSEREGEQNARASMSCSENPSNVMTLKEVGIEGDGHVLSQIVYLSSSLRVFKILQIVPPTSTRNGFQTTTIVLQRKTMAGSFTFFLPYNKKFLLQEALMLIN